MAENTVGALVARIAALEETITAQTKQIEDMHASNVAHYVTLVEFLESIQTTVNEAHTMSTDVSDTFKAEVVPLLRAAQSHPLARVMVRKAARNG